MSIGQNIKRIRKAKGITQQQLAKRMGITQASVTDMERHRGRISRKTAIRYANGLGVDVRELYDNPRPESIDFINYLNCQLSDMQYEISKALNHGDYLDEKMCKNYNTAIALRNQISQEGKA